MKRTALFTSQSLDDDPVVAVANRRKGKLRSGPADPELSPTSQEEELGRLKRLGFTSLAECFLSIPKGYNDYTRPIRAVSRPLVEHIIGKGKVMAYMILEPVGFEMFDGTNSRCQRLAETHRLIIRCIDGNRKPVNLTVFRNVWPWKGLVEALAERDGSDRSQMPPLHVYGALTVFRAEVSMQSPALVHPSNQGKVVPNYVGKAGQVSGERLGAAIQRAAKCIRDAEIIMLAQAGLREDEFRAVVNAVELPVECPEINEPIDLLESLHFPQTVAEGMAACDVARRLSAETVVRQAVVARTRLPVPGSSVIVTNDRVNELSSILPHTPTGDQVRAIEEIVKDIRSPYAMNRLLSGDVGTGKSLTFQLPAVAVMMAGANVAILVPSQLLVTQMANELRDMFKLPDDKVVEVVNTSAGGADKATGKARDPGGAAASHRIYVGTTALSTYSKKRKLKFGLLVIDEQHKFSVEQKAALRDRNTNVLEATATAIPRSLALVNFGGMDVSILRESPVKKLIKTRLVGDFQDERVIDFVRKVVEADGQAAVIYPLVDKAAEVEGEAPAGGGQLKSVVEAGQEWGAMFGHDRVAVLHGKLSPAEKDEVIRRFKRREADVLVSSVVIEVGVTLPSLKAVIVRHAERFGVSQLHQLRGRLARQGGRGFMFLMTPLVGPEGDDPEAGETLERLRLVEGCSDGFTLAEADMEMRGFGDVADDSDMQSGNARALFHNARLTKSEIEASAKRIGFNI